MTSAPLTLTDAEKSSFERVKGAFMAESNDSLGMCGYEDRTALLGQGSWGMASATWRDIETLIRLIDRLSAP